MHLLSVKFTVEKNKDDHKNCVSAYKSLLGESGILHVVGEYVNLSEKIHVPASFCPIIQ